MIIRKDSFLNLAKAIFRTIRYVLSGAPVMAPDEIFKERLDICRACPKNFHFFLGLTFSGSFFMLGVFAAYSLAILGSVANR